MSDPKRLIDDPDLEPAAREALLSLRRPPRAPSAQREALWAAMVPMLPVPSVPPGEGGGLGAPPGAGEAVIGAGGQGAGALSGGGAAASQAALGAKAAVATKVAGASVASKLAAGAGWAGLLKAGAMGAGAMGTLLGAQALMSPPEAPSRWTPAATEVATSTTAARTSPRSNDARGASAPRGTDAPEATTASEPAVALSAATSAPRVVSPRPALDPAPTATTTGANREPSIATAEPSVPPAPIASATATTTGASPDEAVARVQAEANLVNQATQALRSGDSGGALRLLAEASQRFPRGVLGQEREVLTIEALERSGQRGAASARAAAFLQAHPASPFGERLRPLVEAR